MPMFAKYQGIFRSRWRALLWASGVLLTAYCTVPSANDQGDAADAGSQTTAVGGLIGKSHQEEPHKHVNPWAKKQPG